MTEHSELPAVITRRFIPAFVSFRRGDGVKNQFNTKGEKLWDTFTQT